MAYFEVLILKSLTYDISEKEVKYQIGEQVFILSDIKYPHLSLEWLALQVSEYLWVKLRSDAPQSMVPAQQTVDTDQTGLF